MITRQINDEQVRQLRAELAQAIRSAVIQSFNGRTVRKPLSNGWWIEVCGSYVNGTGHHRAWKHLFYLENPQRKQFGGYDNAAAFLSWAVRFINRDREAA